MGAFRYIKEEFGIFFRFVGKGLKKIPASLKANFGGVLKNSSKVFKQVYIISNPLFDNYVAEQKKKAEKEQAAKAEKADAEYKEAMLRLAQQQQMDIEELKRALLGKGKDI